ncbi:MAG TPA: adenylate/guanylate cyclase domain-containing protein [Ramlibacter sp.]|nr:adenylate/guanylate cyclase domain-containing protein [Ramlibacter sp.]
MLTSKEIIERTGISRATLNNYIASGLVPRPQVLPPGPQDGAAPRIGYFPDDTIARIEIIQRLKREGWSIARIAEHLAAHPPVAPAAAAPVEAAAPKALVAAPLAAPAPASPLDPALRLWLPQGHGPAYLVNENFRIVWANDEARSSALSPLAGVARGASGSVLPHLMATAPEATRDALLRFHLDMARQRSAAAADLLQGMLQDQAAWVESLYGESRAQEPRLVSHLRIAASAAGPARLVYAVQFRDGVLFVYGAPLPEESAAPRPAAAPATPALTPVAVLVATLHDAQALWVRLTAQEYFELLNEVWAEVDRIFRRHHGVRGTQTGEVLVCYFLPAVGGSYLWNALVAAQQTRDALRQVSRRWKQRKSWDVELSMNVGLDEGQEWIGGMGPAEQGSLRVLGDAADRAEQLSRASRPGAILVTRSLLGKAAPEELRRVTYGVPATDGSDGRVLFTFARLADITPSSPVSGRFADLAVAELLDLQFPHNEPGPRGGA